MLVQGQLTRALCDRVPWILWAYNRYVRHKFAFKLLRGETGEVALAAAPEGLAVGHGLWALVEDAALGPADTPAG